jgi:hypothetical protein
LFITCAKKFNIEKPIHPKMKNFTLFIIAIYLSGNMMAQVQGSPSTFTTSPIAGSDRTWANTSNAAASDNLYSNYGGFSSGAGVKYTDYLVATNFGFSIPANATNIGIIVEIERSDPSPVSRTADYSIKIVKGGIITGTDKSSGAGYSRTDAYQLFGSGGDQWGTTWTAADINAVDFGVAVAAQRSSNGTNAGRIDHILITVVYDITLPLKLISFSGIQSNNKVRLDWSTSDESGMSRFELEKSLNGADFTKITTVNCTNRYITTNYSFTDENTFEGKIWYRLKIISNSGDAKYSKAIAVKFSNNKKLTLFPSAFQAGTDLSINNSANKKLFIKFFNAAGQVVGTSATSSNRVAVNTASTTAGIIYYKIVDDRQTLLGSGSIIVQ